ncbi:hypothetical protein BH10PLA1_BH10PLA1_10090 [soil metagenome]
MSQFIEQLESRQYMSTSLSNPAYLDIQPTEAVVTAQVNNYHKQQIYIVHVFKSGLLNLRLEGLTGDATLELVSDRNHNNRLDSGEVVQKSAHLLAANESIVRMVNAGTYQIVVLQAEGNAIINYTLRYSTKAFTTPDQVDQTGNDTAHARDISVPRGSNRTVNEYVGANDSADVYKMDVTETMKYDIRLSGLTKNADVTLTDADGNVLATTTGKAMSSKLISGKLEAGTYYLTIVAVDLPTSYALRLAGSTAGLKDTNLTNARVSAKPLAVFSNTPISAKIAILK